ISLHIEGKALFSGIIQAVQNIESLERLDQGARFTIARPAGFELIKPGASVAVDGVCLTVENDSESSMQFFVGAETDSLLNWTARYSIGSKVNLEPSLRLGDPVDGHFVSGHVDSLGVVIQRSFAGDSLLLDIELADELERLVWHKGSLAVNG